MTLQPYPSYKDSGVSWLGEVPEQWEVRRIKTLFREKDERSGDGNGLLLSLTRARGIVPQSEASNRMASAEDLSKYKVCRPGDLVMNRMQAWSGMFAVSSREGLVSPDYSVFAAIGASKVKYFEYLLKTPILVDQFAQRSKGIGSGFNRLYTPEFGTVPCGVPPLPEQYAIVRFLDHEDRRIRRYIAAKKKLIVLLNEQKQAIIHRAVTRGLDPSVALKPSGVAWLGTIPTHWDVSRSRRLFAVRTELARPGDVQLSSTQAYGVIPQSEFEAKVGRKVVRISMHLEKRRHVEKSDFVISMRSFQGGLERAWASGAIRSSYVVLRPEPGVDVNFFTYLFKSQGYIGALQATADFIRDGQDLTYANFRRVDLPLVPLDEQRQIARLVGKAISDIEASISRLHGELDLVHEYHTRLITDVATGKLDVREAAARLPDVIEAPDTLDESEIQAEDDESADEAQDVDGMEASANE